MLNTFSYNEYTSIINWVKSKYPIMGFEDINPNISKFCVIRHDVEFSVDRSLQLAQLEHELGIQTTYLFQIRNNSYNIFSGENIEKITQIHSLGHKIGLHVHCSAINDYNSISDMILNDIDIMGKMLNIDVNIFSFHRPNLGILIQNLYIPKLINTYSDLFFHPYKADTPQVLKVKYIADSNHMWKYGYPTTVNNNKLQLNFHPFSWTKEGYENTKNFQTLIGEKSNELIKTLSDEIKTFPESLKNI